jgi:hypothetical protein
MSGIPCLRCLHVKATGEKRATSGWFVLYSPVGGDKLEAALCDDCLSFYKDNKDFTLHAVYKLTHTPSAEEDKDPFALIAIPSSLCRGCPSGDHEKTCNAPALAIVCIARGDGKEAGAHWVTALCGDCRRKLGADKTYHVVFEHLFGESSPAAASSSASSAAAAPAVAPC